MKWQSLTKRKYERIVRVPKSKQQKCICWVCKDSVCQEQDHGWFVEE